MKNRYIWLLTIIVALGCHNVNDSEYNHSSRGTSEPILNESDDLSEDKNEDKDSVFSSSVLNTKTEKGSTDEPDTGSELDLDSDVDSDTGSGVLQNPVTIIISNQTDEVKYLRHRMPGALMSVKNSNNRDVSFFRFASCIADCDVLINSPEELWLGCYWGTCHEEFYAVIKINPQEEYKVDWDGYVYTLERPGGGCECQQATDPDPGDYTFEFAVYDDFTCWYERCPVGDTMIIFNAFPAGEGAEYSYTMTIPYNDETIEFIID